jgi:ribonucleoside-diphosphate reductase subunit M2
MPLAFFASSDGLVNENLITNFCEEVQCMEARVFYGFQAMIENIHNEMYSLMIDELIDDKQTKATLFNAVNTLPAIQEKAAWTRRWCDAWTAATFAERLVAFAVVEGVFFSASFCAIYWIKQRGLMPGLCFANKLISRDEGLHCEFACLLHSKLLYPASPSRIRMIVQDAVAIECNSVRKSLPVALISMNADLMCQYVEFCHADRLLVDLGQPRMDLFNTKNPFEWMVTISLQGKTNFFEKRVVEYAKSGVCAMSSAWTTISSLRPHVPVGARLLGCLLGVLFPYPYQYLLKYLQNQCSRHFFQNKAYTPLPQNILEVSTMVPLDREMF